MEELDVSQAIWKMLTSIAFTDGHISQIPGNLFSIIYILEMYIFCVLMDF